MKNKKHFSVGAVPYYFNGEDHLILYVQVKYFVHFLWGISKVFTLKRLNIFINITLCLQVCTPKS